MTLRRGLSRLYNGETEIEFIGRWKIWFTLSAVVIAIGLAGLLGRGLNLGIDFRGGVSWEAPAGGASVSDVRSAVEGAGLLEAKLQSLSGAGGTVIRVQAEEVDDETSAEVVAALVEVTGSAPNEISFNEVGPSWGREISEKAARALVVFLVLVSLYIALRFEWKMALATLAALIHDILVTIGVYAVAGFPVTPATVVAFLTILGYSIYDGIVVFDRVDENAKQLATTGDRTYSRMVNDSMNGVLMRTLNTSVTSLLPILSLLVIGSYVLGATTLEEFALVLFIGLLSSSYSSIFVASPLLALLKEREPRWITIRRRLEARSGVLTPTGGGLRPTGGDVAPAEQRAERGGERTTVAAPPIIQPRGRKKGKRR